MHRRLRQARAACQLRDADCLLADPECGQHRSNARDDRTRIVPFSGTHALIVRLAPMMLNTDSWVIRSRGPSSEIHMTSPTARTSTISPAGA